MRLSDVAMIIGFLCLGLALIIFVCMASAHDDLSWMTSFKSNDGSSCCGQMDCFPADVTVYSQEKGELSINGLRMTIPASLIHRMPSDVPMALGYWCSKNLAQPMSASNIRCVFFHHGYN